MLRLFVAIDLPEDVRTRLAALCHGVPGAKWVPPENLHLTLRFIGEVDEALAADIDESLSRIRARAFDLSLAEIGHFGSGGSVRTLWAGVERSDALQILHDKVETALIRTGVAPDRRKFLPHVTLARLKNARLSRVRDFLAQTGPFRAGPFPVSRFVLYVSFLAQEGAIHEPAAEYPLGE